MLASLRRSCKFKLAHLSDELVGVGGGADDRGEEEEESLGNTVFACSMGNTIFVCSISPERTKAMAASFTVPSTSARKSSCPGLRNQQIVLAGRVGSADSADSQNQRGQ
jgi:hypothetical protein